MYLQESKEEDDKEEEEEHPHEHKTEAKQPHSSTQPTQLRPEPGVHAPQAETDPSGTSHHRLPPSSGTSHHPPSLGGDDALLGAGADAFAAQGHNLSDMYRLAGGATATARFGAGDVSLTLGLRHAGGPSGGSSSEKSRFSVRDFSHC